MSNPMSFTPQHPSLEQPTLSGADLLSLLQRTPIATLEKVLMVCDAIDKIDITKDGNLYVKLKKGMIIETNGCSLLYSKDYPFAIQVPLLHLNPDYKDKDNKRLELDNILNEIESK